MALLARDTADTSSSLRFSTGDAFAESALTLTGGITLTADRESLQLPD